MNQIKSQRCFFLSDENYKIFFILRAILEILLCKDIIENHSLSDSHIQTTLEFR